MAALGTGAGHIQRFSSKRPGSYDPADVMRSTFNTRSSYGHDFPVHRPFANTFPSSDTEYMRSAFRTPDSLQPMGASLFSFDEFPERDSSRDAEPEEEMNPLYLPSSFRTPDGLHPVGASLYSDEFPDIPDATMDSDDRVDAMGIQKSSKSENCELVDAKSVGLFHFTACQKPWLCAPANGLCNQMIEEWWSLRGLIEHDRKVRVVSRSEGCIDNNYQSITF